MTVQMSPVNVEMDLEDENEFGDLGESMAEYAEMEYFCQAAQTVAASLANNKGAVLAKNKNSLKNPKATEDFIGLEPNPEDTKQADEESIGELEKLREENKRLKKTLLDKFQGDEEIWGTIYCIST